MPEKAWSGVFRRETDPRVERFTESISFDQHLYRHDIMGSLAHARMLFEVGILTDAEFAAIEGGLFAIQREIEDGTFVFSYDLEDIHMHIEKSLIQKIGDAGRKLHTARSRNDQISTDLRLWTRDAIDHIILRIVDLQNAFIGRCEHDFHVTMPGYTHMQRAQPVLAPHYWIAYCEKLDRDRDRLRNCRARVNVLSLGGAAVAGTSLPIDRFKTRLFLGFDDVAANSMDISSDRDFLLEFAYCLAQLALHLSGWAEEWILWSTAEFNFIRLPEAFCTGSSIMPQKMNPDVLELIRGKTARVIGNLQTLLVLTKGLPLAYNRDLQEDKEPIFDSFNTLDAMLELAAPIVAGMVLNTESISSRLDKGYLDATSLMEYLIKKGVPQRSAHGFVGKLVRYAMEKDVPLASLPLKVFRDVYEGFDYNVFEVLGAVNAVNSMQSYGSTGPDQVKVQIQRWKEKLGRE
ncbi:MAG: argininosuccinate lyase [Thermoguttaceae bacterium]